MVSDIRSGQRVRMESFDHYIYVMITCDLSLQAAFHSRLVHHFVAIGLKKMKFCFEICGKNVSPSDFVIIARTHAYSFPRLFYFELVELSMNLGNIVELGRPKILFGLLHGFHTLFYLRFFFNGLV